MKTKTLLIAIGTAAAVGVAAFGIRAYLHSKAAPVRTVAARRGPVTQIVSETGKLIASDDLTLSFKQSGRVEKILVKEGDAVKEGRPLLQLDTSALQIQRKQALASQAAAQAKYDQALAGATDEQIRVATSAVQNAQTALDARTTAQADLKTSDARALDASYATLEGAIESLYVKASSTMQTLRNDLFDVKGNLTPAIRSADSGAQTAAAGAFITASDALSRMGANIVLFRGATHRADEDALARGFISDGKIVRDAASSASAMLQSSIPVGIAQTDLNARVADVKAVWTDVSAAVSAADADTSALASTRSTQASAENAAGKDVETAQGALTKAKDELAQLTAPLRSVDKEVYASAVASARAGVQLIDQEIADSTLTAPTDGVVGSIDISLGEIAQANASIGTLVSSKYEIESQVSELDIAGIQPGQPVRITFDALRGQSFTGHVLTVAPREITKNEDIYYKVKVAIDGENDGIRIGMTGNLDIRTGHKDDALLVPRRQVYRSGGSDYVKIVPADNKPVETQVTVGLRGLDDDEILNGVKEGDRVLVE